MFHITCLWLLRSWSILLNIPFSICIVSAGKCLFASISIFPEITNLGLPCSLVHCDMSLRLHYSIYNRIKNNCRMFLHIAIKKCCLLSASFEVCLATCTWLGFLKSCDFNASSLGIFPCGQTLDLLFEDKKSMKKGLGRTHLPAGLPGGRIVGHHLTQAEEQLSWASLQCLSPLVEQMPCLLCSHHGLLMLGL